MPHRNCCASSSSRVFRQNRVWVVTTPGWQDGGDERQSIGGRGDVSIGETWPGDGHAGEKGRGCVRVDEVARPADAVTKGWICLPSITGRRSAAIRVTGAAGRRSHSTRVRNANPIRPRPPQPDARTRDARRPQRRRGVRTSGMASCVPLKRSSNSRGSMSASGSAPDSGRRSKSAASGGPA